MFPKTDSAMIVMLRDQITYVTEHDREWCEIDPDGVALIAEDLEQYHKLVGLLKAAGRDGWKSPAGKELLDLLVQQQATSAAETTR
jgi:hypothetical protein